MVRELGTFQSLTEILSMFTQDFVAEWWECWSATLDISESNESFWNILSLLR